MKNKMKYLFGLMLAMVMCCSLAYAATASASAQKKGHLYELTVTGSGSNIKCYGESQKAWTVAHNNATTTYYVRTLSTKSMSGASVITSNVTNGSIPAKGNMIGAQIDRAWNSSYRYIHNMKLSTNYYSPTITDDLTMTVWQDYYSN